MSRGLRGPASERVLVVGCGYVGTALAMRLVGEGHNVWALRREAAKLPTSVHAIEADVRVPNTLRNLPDVDWLYYVVGPESAREEASRAAAHEGVRYLLGAVAAQKLSLQRFVYASCVEVYGDRRGAWVDEDSEPTPSTARGEHLLAGEELVRAARLRSTIVRLGELYGPDRLGLLEAARSGRALPEATDHANLIHRDDAANALVHVMALKKRAADLYVAVDREPARRIEVVSWLAEQLGTEAPAIDGAATDAGVDVRCMSERLVEHGFKHRYPSFREGYAVLSRPR